MGYGREGERGKPPSQPGGQKAGEKEKSVGVRRVHPSGGKSGEGRAGNPAGPTGTCAFRERVREPCQKN